MGEMNEAVTPAPDVTTVETSTENGNGTPETPAEAQNTEHMIPKSRLDEVIGQRNAEREEKAELKRRLDDLEQRIQAPAKPHQETASLPAPPAGLSEREAVEWYVRHDAERFIEEKLGFGLDVLKQRLDATATISQESAEMKWQKACSGVGLDPKDTVIQAAVLGLVKSHGMPFEQAMKVTAEKFGKPAAPVQPAPAEPTATVTDGGVSGVVTAAKRLPSTLQEVAEMARKGERAPHLSTLDILAQKRE
jgi:hypothetical protein